MFFYGKTAANAIAAMSYLAERYTEPPTKVSSADIAAVRKISKPLVAKLLTILSQAGLVSGMPGPGGGYFLAKSPDQICLIDIVALFERMNENVVCPFGDNWCGQNDPCPMHDKIAAVQAKALEFLKETRLDIFAEAEKTKAL